MTVKKRSPLPFGMHGAQTVVIDDMVFVGGGITNREDGVNFLVFKYNPRDNVWYTLPPCPVTNFGLAAVDEKPVLFGGKVIAQGAQITDDCFTFLADSNQWRKEIPSMPRKSCTSICTSNSIFVIVWDQEGAMMYNSFVKEWQILDKWFKPNNKPLLQPVIVDNACFSIHSDISYSNQVMHKLELPIVRYDTVNVVHKFQTLIQDENLNFDYDNGGSLMKIDESLFCISTSGSTNYASISSILSMPTSSSTNYSSFPMMTSSSTNYSSFPMTTSGLSLMFYSSIKKSWITLAKNFIPQVILSPACATLSDGSILVIGGKDVQEKSLSKVSKLTFT